jgi:3-deoxy-D-manno-octulosonate 8-phosphate phosphatase (KDO 8-P phosphatase)
VPSDPATVEQHARRIRLVLLDVDGVLTDGTILVADDGTEQKRFSIRDGSAVVWAHAAGLLTGLLSGRPSAAAARRAAQLGIPIVVLGTGDKLEGLGKILTAHGLSDDEVAYMGDDLLDLPVLARVGLSAAPSDGAAEVRERVHWVSSVRGGHGAVREFIELILCAQGHWDPLVAGYLEREAT